MRFLALALLLCCAALTQAAVYVGKSCVWTQPDGTPVAVRIWGDEFTIDVETPDGWSLRRDANNWWRYAKQAADGSLEPSALAVGAGDPTTLGVPKHLRQSRAQRRAEFERNRILLERDTKGRINSQVAIEARAARLLNAGPRAAPGVSTVGTRKGITILVSFSDRPADVVHSQATINNYCNQVGYNGFGNNGSVRDYFYDNSLGRLVYTNVVTAYIEAPQPRAYYADNTVLFGVRARELVVAALDAVNPTIDFADFDNNNDGFIDAVNIFYAGTCPNTWRQGLWPHQWTVTWNSGDSGKRASVYQMTDMGPTLELGTFCHETGHMICDFPDIYDYDYDSRGGAGVFCLMNSGGNGTNPARVGGYLALSAGWRDAVDLLPTSAVQTATTWTAAVPFAATPMPEKDILRYRKPGVTTEYFLYENRRATGRDALLPCSGVAIWHIDELGERDDQRYAKNGVHQNFECALVQADNLRHFESDINDGDAQDLWYAGNSSMTGIFEDGDGSNAQANDSRWWDGTESGLIIENFSAPGLSMTFDYRIPSLPPPPSEKLTFASTQVVDYEGNGGSRFIYLTVLRQSGYVIPASVDWTTVDGSAVAGGDFVGGADFVGASGTVSWAQDETAPKTIAIQVNGDSAEELDEFFTVHLANPQGTGNPILGANTNMSIVLRNDDGPSYTAGQTSAAVIQPSGTGDSGSCGAGALAGLIALGGFGLLRRRRR